ncbi:unnamed protein product [Paramecium octaurelia]|uniref:Transmembrane protein n=1 Tax=Paramecium octaurelia TaxID=43137 RepID=A0A8S1S9U4_PAROT|nr:unnamed protein product [Paramecium octaurelia]
MKLIITLLINLFVPSLQQCVTVQPNVTYYTSLGEVYRWQADSLIKGSGLNYTLTQSSFMEYHPAFAQIAPEKDHQGVQSVVYALRAYDIASTGAWTNHFAYLELDSSKRQYDIYFAIGSVIEMDQTPNFDKKVQLTRSEQLIDCFDIEYINPELWIVDCAERSQTDQPMKNYLYFVNQNDSPDTAFANRQEVPNHQQYKSIKGRKFQYHVYYKTNMGEENELGAPQPKQPIRMLLRGQQAFNSEKGTLTVLDNDCSIDLLMRNDDGIIKDTGNVLDKTRISTDVKKTVNFTLIDFKVMPNGQVYILDQTEGIYVYKVTEEGDWKYVKTLQYNGKVKAYAFDVNNRLLEDGNSYLHIAIVYEQNIMTYLNDRMERGFRLPFTATYTAQVSLSQQYVVVVNEQILYLYNTEKNYLLHKEMLISSNYLVNPYAPDVVVVSETISRRYELSDGYLECQNTNLIEKNTLKLVATDGNSICQSIINYQILTQDNTKVLELGHNPFPSMITFPALPFSLQDLASGPNLDYVTPDVDHVDVEVTVHFLWELEVKEIKWFDAASVVYADVLVDPHHTSSNKFYLFLQHKNKTAIIWDCSTVNYNDNHCTCEKQDEFTLPITLNRFNSQFDWYTFDSEALNFQFQVSDYEIEIYQSFDNSHYKIANITYEAKPENRITSFTSLKQNIFIVLQYKKEIDVISGIVPTLQKFPIDEDLINSYNLNCTFTPLKVYGDVFVKSEFIFIVTEDCVILGDQRYHFTLIDAFQYKQGSQIELAIGQKTFYIITSLEGEDSIKEYNYENLNDIYLMKSLPLYNRYKLQLPLTIDFVYETGFLFIRAFDKILSETVFLIYESNILYRNSLHKVLKTHLNIPDSQVIETAASGFDQMFVYFNDLKTQHLVVVLRDSLMEIKPTHLSESYTTNLNARVSIQNSLSDTKVAVSYPVKFINTQSIVRLNETILSKNHYEFDAVNTLQYIKLENNGWYLGHVTNFQIDCLQCQKGVIEIRNPFEAANLSNVEFASHSIIDGSKFKDTVVYLSSPKSLIFQNDDDTIKFISKIDVGQQCSSITTYNEFIVVSCTDDQSLQILYVAKCDLSQQKCTPIQSTTSIQLNLQQVSKIKYVNSVLYLLDSNQENPKEYQGSLHAYQMQLEAQWSLKNEKIFDAQYFGQKTDSDFYISDFDIAQFQQGNTQYQKILLQTTGQITYFIQIYLDNGLIKDNHKDSFSLTNTLNENFAVKSNTKFYQIRVLSISTQTNLLNITTLITTNNVAQYGVTFSYDITNPLNQGSPVKSTIMIPFILNQYGVYQALNKLTVSQEYALVPYTNYTHLLISVYKLPQLTAVTSTNTTVITMNGATLEALESTSRKFALVLQQDPISKSPAAYQNIIKSEKTQNYVLMKYPIYDFARLAIQNGVQIKSQPVYLKAQNDYSFANGLLEIINNSAPPKPDDDDKSSSLLWLWILLSVVGSLALIGVIGYFVYTKIIKRPIQVTDSAKVSLMQQ